MKVVYTSILGKKQVVRCRSMPELWSKAFRAYRIAKVVRLGKRLACAADEVLSEAGL
jgi:hypothetical protein